MPSTTTTPSPSWDIFISHASDDKTDLVRPLSQALVALGLRLWYDEVELRVGDSLRRRIDDGLARASFGLVVLSESFFAKKWPQRELDGLAARDVDQPGVILPLLHGISVDQVRQHSPTLADKVALDSALGVRKLSVLLYLRVRESQPSLATRLAAKFRDNDVDGTVALLGAAPRSDSAREEWTKNGAALSAVIGALLAHESTVLRSATLVFLNSMHDEVGPYSVSILSSVRPLLDVHDLPDLQIAAARVLGQFNDRLSLDVLMKLASTCQTSWVRQTAFRATTDICTHWQDEGAERVLAAVLRSGDADAVPAAVSAVRRTGSAQGEALAALREITDDGSLSLALRREAMAGYVVSLAMSFEARHLRRLPALVDGFVSRLSVEADSACEFVDLIIEPFMEAVDGPYGFAGETLCRALIAAAARLDVAMPSVLAFVLSRTDTDGEDWTREVRQDAWRLAATFDRAALEDLYSALEIWGVNVLPSDVQHFLPFIERGLLPWSVLHEVDDPAVEAYARRALDSAAPQELLRAVRYYAQFPIAAAVPRLQEVSVGGDRLSVVSAKIGLAKLGELAVEDVLFDAVGTVWERGVVLRWVSAMAESERASLTGHARQALKALRRE